MKYQELYTEYCHLLREEIQLCQQLDDLPRGNLTVKRISGKEYHYLQHSASGRKTSEYIKAARLAEIQAQLELRNKCSGRLDAVKKQEKRLEDAAQILDTNLSMLLFHIRNSYKMDAMPLTQRRKALAFATAMTALEGLPAKAETDARLNQWVNGAANFADYYLRSLQEYHVLEVPL